MILSTGKKTEVIHMELRQRILAGEWKEGERLPTEAELAQSFDCSIGTVSKGVALLVHDGLVERRPRTGTRVIRNTATPPVSQTSQKLDAFAFIYPSAQHESTWRMMKSFQMASKENSRRMVTLDTGVDYQREAEYISRLIEFDVCGAVISPVLYRSEDYAHFCGILLKCSVPIVIVGTQLHGIDCPAVFFDAFHAGYSSALHLIERGAKNIGFLSNEASITRSYYDGYIWALEEKGLRPRADLVLRDNSIHPNFENPVDEPTQLGTRYLETCSPDVDGVVCANDYIGLGLVRAAKATGRKVPKDLKVVGIDGLEASAANDVPLTSYHYPFEEAGRSAFKMLDRLVSGEISGHQELKLRGRIVPGAST
jgi:DNA-binding LacI/PurR family transcriptional regulator